MRLNKVTKKHAKCIALFPAFVLLLVSFSAASNAADHAKGNGLDPTRPLFGSKTATNILRTNKKLVLESIFHGSYGYDPHTAVINGKPMKVNDTIGEYRLVKVNDESVILLSSEKRLKLYIFSQKIIK